MSLIASIIPLLMRAGEVWSDKEKDRISLALSQLEAQTKINEKEAQHKSVFVAGWRPFIGWVGGIAIAYNFVGQPLLQTFLHALGIDVIVSQLDITQLIALVSLMLGQSAMRSFDKSKGVSTDHLDAFKSKPDYNE